MGDRTTCVDEMLVTLPMARCAIAVSRQRGHAAGVAPPRPPAVTVGRGRGSRRHLRRAHPAGQDEPGHQTERDRRHHEKQASEHGSVFGGQRTSILRDGGGGALGMVMVSTPSARSAAMRSPTMCSANWNTRLKLPCPRSTVGSERRRPTRARFARALNDQPRILDRQIHLLPGQSGSSAVTT